MAISTASFLTCVDDKPVSLPSTFARVYEQHVSLTNFYCPIDQRYCKE